MAFSTFLLHRNFLDVFYIIGDHIKWLSKRNVFGVYDSCGFADKNLLGYMLKKKIELNCSPCEITRKAFNLS